MHRGSTIPPKKAHGELPHVSPQGLPDFMGLPNTPRCLQESLLRGKTELGDIILGTHTEESVKCKQHSVEFWALQFPSWHT